eukprot:TRINITY_DN1137_c0_g1_i1.p1 TRINITY_DN1137_c0_g1~~TRINITY_DN1137_c0_g1_i1.p1  ORF type:complete len:196 (-),score=70.08 TRINITY_DN1137_c0_g1_i1:41-577(-)
MKRLVLLLLATALAHAGAVSLAADNATAAEVAGALARLGVAPGAATAAACAKLKTLKAKFVEQRATAEEHFAKQEKAKFVEQRATAEEHFAKQEKAYVTKICEGLGCEQDPAKREANLAEWKLIEASHAKEMKRLDKMLSDCEEIIESDPFRRCPEFEQYLTDKRTAASGKELLDNQA